jgi:hypothetical protein
VLGLGIFYDFLAVALYRLLVNTSFKDNNYRALDVLVVLCLVLGTAGTCIGSLMWSRRASNASVSATVVSLALLTLMYVKGTKFGFDDPRIIVPFFAGFVIFLLIIGRAVGYAEQNR